MPKHTKGADGYYRASIVIGRTESGSQRRKTVKAKTVKELERKLSEVKMQFDRGIDFDASKMTVKQWSVRWLNVYKDPAVGASTQANTRSLLNKHILPHDPHTSAVAGTVDYRTEKRRCSDIRSGQKRRHAHRNEL